MSTITIADVELIHAKHAADLDAANRKQEWLARITAPQEIDGLMTEADHDEIDELMQLDPYAGDPPSKRSDKETDRLLSILDALDERGNG
jgi:hypothetical protein